MQYAAVRPSFLPLYTKGGLQSKPPVFVTALRIRLHSHNLFCLYLDHLINLFDIFIRNLLKIVFQIFDLIFRNFRSFKLLKRYNSVTTDISDSHFRSLSFFLHIFCQFFSPILRKFREYEANRRTVISRIDAEI